MNETVNLNNLNQNLYIGMDTHSKDWTVSIYSDEFELKTYTQPPDPEIMSKFLHKNYPGFTYYCVYEASFGGFWIQRALEGLGINCIVTHPADVPTKHKEKNRKTDKADSRKLARGLRSKELDPIYIPSVEQESDRALLRARSKLTKDQTRSKNRIKSFLKLHNIIIGDCKYWSKQYVAKLQQLQFPNAYAIFSFDSYLKEYLSLNEQQKLIDKKIIELSKEPRYKENVKLLLTIPSIGLTTAMVLLTEIGDINRFETRNHLYSYFGLTPNIYSSSDHESVGAITKRGNKYLKSVIVECAWTAVRKDPALLKYYKGLLVRMDSNTAIIRVTRKLINRIRFVLNTKTEYKINVA